MQRACRITTRWLVALMAGFSLHAMAEDWFQPCFNGDYIEFKTEFSNVVSINEDSAGQFATLSANTRSTPCSSSVRSPQLDFGKLRVQYQGGNLNQRWAAIEPAPDDRNNLVMDFTLREPNVKGEKGRVQLVADGNKGLKIMRIRTRLYLTEGMRVLQDYPNPLRWLTIAEWWNNGDWTGSPYPFRITLGMLKPESGKGNLRFDVRSETFDRAANKWNTVVWQAIADSFPIPVGQWMTLEYVVAEGNAKTGRFMMMVTPEGGERQTLFDITNFTHHPADPAPDGFVDFHPLKLYTSAALVQYVAGRQQTMSILWDDLTLRGCSRWQDCAAVAVPSAPGGVRSMPVP